MSTQGPGRDAGKPRDGTRARILAAARELFGTVGFDQTTVRQIAQQVGMTDAALYYHFKSKREILTALWDVPVGAGLGRLKPNGPLTGEQLDTIADTVVAFSAANEHILRLISREALRGDKTAIALRLQNRSFMRKTLHEHFSTVMEAAEAELRTEAVVALLTGTTLRTQIESRGRYRRIASSRQFRERTRRWVRAVARLDELEAG